MIVFYRRTPLYAAAEKGSKDVAQLLIQAGADLNIVDKEGYVVHTIASHLLI